MREEKEYCKDCGQVQVWCICGLDKASLTTFEVRFNQFAKDLRKLKVRFRRNVYECCRGCITEEKLGMKSENDPIIWHYGGQGHAFDLEGNKVYARTNTWGYSASDGYGYIYLNHYNISDELSEQIVKLLDEHYFSYTWNDGETITIDPEESVSKYLFHMKEITNLNEERLLQATFDENVTRFMSVSC